MEEPSILDYIKSKLYPRRYPLPDFTTDHEPVSPSPIGEQPKQDPTAQIIPIDRPTDSGKKYHFPFRGMSAMAFALLGQAIIGPQGGRDWKIGTILLIISLLLIVWAEIAGELILPVGKKWSPESDPPTINFVSLIVGGFLALVAFISFGSLEFSILNLGLLAAALWFVVRGFWISRPADSEWLKMIWEYLRTPPWKFNLSITMLGSAVVLGLVAFFRFFHLVDVPPEMNSDHAEKFLDVLRVLNNQTQIFFPSNGGREALQFYLVAGLHNFLNLPLDFFILKIVTTVIGFLALPFMYLLGKEIGGHRTGVLTFLMAGIAYWPNVVARVGLRLPFYMLFSAALLFFLLRGFRRGSRNDFIFGGITLGLSFYGYAADRILPLLVLAAVGLFLVHRQPAGRKTFALLSLLCLVTVSLVIFLPLFRYILAEPESFFLRTFTRMGSWEKPIEGSALTIFFGNAAKALAMFSWDAGVVWPISIPGYPALSMVSGALFYIGLALIMIRYIRNRTWVDLFLLISIPILLLPSILAIAFPSENPNLYRTSGAAVPVFLLAALSLNSLMDSIQSGFPGVLGRRLAYALAGFLLVINMVQDYDLVFHRYYESYLISSWNSSEMGRVAKDFIDLHQAPDNVWVVGFPNWVDTRLVANNAGFPGRDYELKVENIPKTLAVPGPKLFILNPQDTAGLEALLQNYPDGWVKQFSSKVNTKDFMIFYVLPSYET